MDSDRLSTVFWCILRIIYKGMTQRRSKKSSSRLHSEHSPSFFVALFVILVLVGIIIFRLVLPQSSPSELLSNNKIIINDCQTIAPPFISVEEGQTITFVNKDRGDHTVYLGGVTIIVPRGESRTVEAKFSEGAGTYAYDCDSVRNVAQVSVAGLNDDELGGTIIVHRTFQEFYDRSSVGIQNCLRFALQDVFEEAYSDSSYRPTNDEAMRINQCFAEVP